MSIIRLLPHFYSRTGQATWKCPVSLLLEMRADGAGSSLTRGQCFHVVVFLHRPIHRRQGVVEKPFQKHTLSQVAHPLMFRVADVPLWGLFLLIGTLVPFPMLGESLVTHLRLVDNLGKI